MSDVLEELQQIASELEQVFRSRLDRVPSIIDSVGEVVWLRLG